LDNSRCIDNTNTFTAIDDGDIASYSWDFNGDGVEDSNIANPSYQYPATGSYQTKLTVVSNGGCANSTSQEISIYNIPDTPDFDYSATVLCSSSDITFSNLTNENGSTDIVSYLWDFNGEATSTNKNPTYAFATPGDKTITLTATIPGCSTDTYSENITISEGPNVSFDYTNNCFGEDIQFTNQTTGNNITSYSWNFGDGTPTSTDQNPTHLYAATGEYDITLTVANDGGCQNASLQSITVSD
ncbi:PKD domain-containing protein, partial [Reichenbachiella sp. MSK19-1]|uniref:PKD domain-containing protein n=1 Tax=Reichenbachiella sp. MSK19-1 TaxID=1897631 RepID=UPI000E6BEE9D